MKENTNYQINRSPTGLYHLFTHSWDFFETGVGGKVAQFGCVVVAHKIEPSHEWMSYILFSGVEGDG